MSAVAIVQTAFIGDVILATPLFESARISQPRETVVAVVRKGCENIIETNPYVDELIVWDKNGKDNGIGGIFRIGNLLKKFGVRTALIPHRSLRTALTLLRSGAGVRIGFAKGGGAFLHTDRVPYRLGIHEVERNLMLAEAAGWVSTGFRPSIFPDDHDRSIVDDILRGVKTFCILAPGSVWPTKMWPVESYIEVGSVLSKRGMTVLLSGGMSDEWICRTIADKIPGAFSTCGLITLRQSAELYHRAEFILTGDTAPQHLASAMGTRVFSIFGPTVRNFGFYPYTDRGVIIEEDVECRPCGVHGHMSCPEGTHACMRRVTSERVISIIDTSLEKMH